jgi:hypothetical protein
MNFYKHLSVIILTTMLTLIGNAVIIYLNPKRIIIEDPFDPNTRKKIRDIEFI